MLTDCGKYIIYEYTEIKIKSFKTNCSVMNDILIKFYNIKRNELHFTANPVQDNNTFVMLLLDNCKSQLN